MKKKLVKVKSKENSMGIASLILGIGSIVLCFVPFSIFIGFVVSIIGIILAVKQKRIYPNAIAVAGLVTSIIGLIVSTLYLIFMIIFFVEVIKFGM